MGLVPGVYEQLNLTCESPIGTIQINKSHLFFLLDSVLVLLTFYIPMYIGTHEGTVSYDLYLFTKKLASLNKTFKNFSLVAVKTTILKNRKTWRVCI
jgi:hypothetical protein